MPNLRMAVIFGVMLCLFGGGFRVHSAPKGSAAATEGERAIWDLEHSYWRDVQENNLQAYLCLWHEDFLGWPWVSAAPVHKDHITDWITSQTGKGLELKLVAFKPAAVQVTGDLGVVCYWVTYKWVDKEGAGAEHVSRITHTWIKSGKEWRILGGMSMPEAAGSKF
jgi:hypothetical protein